MNRRFHAPLAAAGRTVGLPEDEAQHAARTLRLKAGDAIRVFDGRGHEFDAVIEKAGKSEVLVAVGVTRDAPAREARVAVTLGQAVLKADKMDDVIRDAVMMGVAAIQPLVTIRTETTLAALQRAHRQERWQRVAVSSAKQCGRAVVPAVLEPLGFREVFDARAIGSAFMLVEPGADEKVLPLTALAADAPDEASILIGPEGGWAPDEIERGGAVAHLVTMGSRTFRADAMAVVALSAFFTLWKEF